MENDPILSPYPTYKCLKYGICTRPDKTGTFNSIKINSKRKPIVVTVSLQEKTSKETFTLFDFLRLHDMKHTIP